MSGLLIVSLAWAIGLWAMLIWAAWSIAETKGRSNTGWAWLAAFYGILAVITVALMPPLHHRG